MQRSAVAVTAFGAVTALGAGVDALWQGQLEGRRPFSNVTTFEARACRVQVAAEVKVPVPLVGDDRSASLAVMAATEALSAGSVDPKHQRVGLVVGSACASTAVLERALSNPSELPVGWWRQYEKRWLADVIASQLNREYGIAIGPRSVVNTACTSGAVAIAIAADWLRAGDCDCVLAIGTDELARFTYTGFLALRSLDPQACRPFDRGRRGLTIGEGAGCLILERSADAVRRGCSVRGHVLAVGLACDAHHLTAPDPEGAGAARAILKGLSESELDVRDIGFVNAHGTGTPLNDVAEVASLERALGAYAPSCPVHSVKGTTGHCMGAAGAIEAVVALRSLETGIVPPTAGLVDSEFEGRVRCVKEQPIHVEASYAISTSFGFGGNDAVVVLAHA
ncbi:MAG TPA: beta-ketoacyl-[acyl-carrier-protein] synthase family protein [Polyangiaceae bacterium]|nr:beta-ketoacyl-[acyl-carrier-protein] synthase family protein [Polyangiaceae bacterium]